MWLISTRSADSLDCALSSANSTDYALDCALNDANALDHINATRALDNQRKTTAELHLRCSAPSSPPPTRADERAR